MALPYRTILSSSLGAHARRFYRYFTNSPSTKPGFLPLESVQKLATRRAVDPLTSSANLPESITALFTKYDQNRPLPSLKGAIHPSEIGNTDKKYIINLL